MKDKLEEMLKDFTERLQRTNALINQETARALKLQGAIEAMELLIKEQNEKADSKDKDKDKKTT